MTKSVDIHYFDLWSPNVAYTLGYTWADGTVRSDGPSRVLRYCCDTVDEDIILGIRADMKSIHKITRWPAKTLPNGLHCEPKTKAAISSTIIVEKLISMYGILPNKSALDLPYPHVPDEHLSSFARGYLDGDGFVNEEGQRCVGWVGSPVFMSGFQDHLCKAVGIPKLKLHPSDTGGLRTMKWSSVEDFRSIYDWLYPPGIVLYGARKKGLMEVRL